MGSEYLNNIFGTWLDPLTRWGMAYGFGKMISTLDEAYKTNVVYPPKTKVFRVFQVTPFDQVKVVMLLQDPYHDGKATGLAAANELDPNSEITHMSPSLQVIYREWQNDPATIPSEEFDPTFVSWANQGVMMLNAALTVRQGEPTSHLSIWRGWTEKFLLSLSQEKPDLVYVLMGRKAQEWKEYIINGRIITVPHPAAEVYAARFNKEAGFYQSRIFSKVNEALSLYKQEPISW